MQTVIEKIIELNRRNHENSVILECTPNKEIQGGTWVKRSELKKLDKLGQPVYMDTENLLLYPMSHDMIIGSTGVGKTTVIYDNQIEYYSSLPEKIRPNLFISDVKGDSYGKLAQRLRDNGYSVYRFDGRNPFFSTRYNPLTAIYRAYHKAKEIEKKIKEEKIGKEYNGVKYKTKEIALGMAKADVNTINDTVQKSIAEIAELMIINTDEKNLSWTQGGRACLRAILNAMLEDSAKPYLGLTEEKFTISNLCRIACDTSDEYGAITEWLEKYEDDSLVVRNALASVYRLRAYVTRDGYVTSMTAELAKFTPLCIEALTSNSDFEIDALVNGDKSFAIFFVPNDRVSIIDNVGMMFLNNILNTLCDKADQSPNGCLERDFVALIDEFANFPKIPDMSKKISTYRSRKIWLQLAVQSIEQLYEKYGKDETGTIIDNCNNTFFLGCNSLTTRESYVAQFGSRIGEEYSVSVGNEECPSISARTIDTPVLKKSDLERIELGTFYLKSSVGNNLKSSMIPYFKRNDVPQVRLEEERLYNGYEAGTNTYTLKDAQKGEEKEEERKRKEELKKKPLAEKNTQFEKVELPKRTFSFFDYNEKAKRSRPNYVVNSDDRKRLCHMIWSEMCQRTKDLKDGNKLLKKIGKQKIFTKDINDVFNKGERENVYYGFVSRDIWLLDLENVLEFNTELGQEKGLKAYLKRLKRGLRLVKSNKTFSKEIAQIFEKLIGKYEKMTSKEFKERYDFIKGLLRVS